MSVRVPRLVPGCDVKSLPLKPSEAFLLSRVDGVTSENDLAGSTGMPLDRVVSAMARLVELGAVGFGDPPPAQSVPGTLRSPFVQPVAERMVRDSTPTEAVSSSRADGRARTQSASELRHAPIPALGNPAQDATSDSPPLYDPAELDEDVELDADRRRRILDFYYRLEEFSYYELLGIHELVDKKQIKSAYYLLAPEYHPDKFFRKRLGSYKAKIEGIFNRITLAHDVLTSKSRRVEYDEYLAQARKNRTMSALLEQTARDVAAVTSAVEESVAGMTSRPPASFSGASSSPASPGRYHDERVRTSAPPTQESVAPRPMSEQERRELLAKKLRGGTSPSRRAPPPPPPPQPPSPAEVAMRAAETLKTRYDSARAAAMRAQIARFVESGKAALGRGDHAAAANAYRIAASLAPEDAELQKSAGEVTQAAAAALAEGYLKQAAYEASQERWGEAASSYAKVATGRPEDAKAHERVAFATLKAGGNTRRAVEFARRAVEIEPKNAELRVTLARAYLSAGLDRSAHGELARAAELAPNDARIRELIARAKE